MTCYSWPLLPTHFPHGLTEEKIERLVESFFDVADRKLMAGEVSQADYDARATQIAAWADDMMRTIR